MAFILVCGVRQVEGVGQDWRVELGIKDGISIDGKGKGGGEGKCWWGRDKCM